MKTQRRNVYMVALTCECGTHFTMIYVRGEKYALERIVCAECNQRGEFTETITTLPDLTT